MLKQILLVCILLPFVLSHPQFQNSQSPGTANYRTRDGRDYSQASIVRSENENTGTGSYRWGFATDAQQTQEATGKFSKPFPNSDLETFGVKGSWSYTDTDNKKVTVRYTADHKGYRETRTFE